MKFVVRSGDTEVALSALTKKRMERLAGLAIGIVEAIPEGKPGRGFGFTAGSNLETEILED